MCMLLLFSEGHEIDVNLAVLLYVDLCQYPSLGLVRYKYVFRIWQRRDGCEGN